MRLQLGEGDPRLVVVWVGGDLFLGDPFAVEFDPAVDDPLASSASRVATIFSTSGLRRLVGNESTNAFGAPSIMRR